MKPILYKPLDQNTVETPAKIDGAASSIEAITQLILLQTMQQLNNQTAASSSITKVPLARESKDPGHDSEGDLPVHPRQNSGSSTPRAGSRLPAPSSPIRPAEDDDSEVALMGRWMIEMEKNARKREELQRSFELLDVAFVTELDHLRDIKFVTSLEVKAGIAYSISTNVSAFKKAYKAERLAAQELLKPRDSGVTGRQYMGMSGEDDDSTDFFVEY